jgi:hypothetical protein
MSFRGGGRGRGGFATGANRGGKNIIFSWWSNLRIGVLMALLAQVVEATNNLTVLLLKF